MKYTVKEVRQYARITDGMVSLPKLTDMLTDYAKRIEWAQSGVTDDIVERAVDARIKRLCEAGSANNVSDNELMRSALLAVWPATAGAFAQMADAFRRGYDQAKLEESINADLQATPTAEPVAQGEASPGRCKACGRATRAVCDGLDGNGLGCTNVPPIDIAAAQEGEG